MNEQVISAQRCCSSVVGLVFPTSNLFPIFSTSFISTAFISPSDLSWQDLLPFIAIFGSTPKHNVKPTKYHNHADHAAKSKPILL
ncbi:hypothetical protein AMTRI_Chr10g230250 [Amborella trichopoda]